MSKDYKIYAVRKNKDDKAFAKEALDILVNAETPADIFDLGNFKPVENGFGSVFVADGSVNTSYNAQAGTDRKEEYYDKNSKGELVKKTRTVTDWTPIAGNHMYSGYGACITADEPDKYSYDPDIVTDCEPYQENLDFETVEPFAVNNETYKIAEKGLIIKAEYDTNRDISNSYDHVKDMRCSSNVSVDAYEQYMIPTQQIKFEYNSKEYYLAAFARDGAYVNKDVPSISGDIEAQVKEMMNYKVARPLVVNLIVGLLYVLIIFFVANSGIARGNDSIGIVFAVILVGVIIFQVVYYKSFKKKYDENRNNIVESLKAKKRETVGKILSKYNY